MDSSDTKNTLLETAAELIRRLERPEDFTVRRFCAQANCNLNAVNYYFGSKAALVREALRLIIARHYRERGLDPASFGSDLEANVVRICDFLFAQPVAAKLALQSELEIGGGSSSLSTETAGFLLSLLAAASPGMEDAERSARVWTLMAAIHQLVLRPLQAEAFLGFVPASKAERDLFLGRLCRLALSPVATGASA
jgi:AcrR family transcriptional regulator